MRSYFEIGCRTPDVRRGEKFSNRAKTLGAASENGVRVGGLVRMRLSYLLSFPYMEEWMSRREKKWFKRLL